MEILAVGLPVDCLSQKDPCGAPSLSKFSSFIQSQTLRATQGGVELLLLGYRQTLKQTLCFGYFLTCDLWLVSWSCEYTVNDFFSSFGRKMPSRPHLERGKGWVKAGGRRLRGKYFYFGNWRKWKQGNKVIADFKRFWTCFLDTGSPSGKTII